MAYVAPTTRSSGNLGDVADYNILCNNDIELESRKDTSYVQFTSSVATATTVEASSTTIVTAGAITANGTDTYEIQFYCPSVTTGASAETVFGLWDGSTQLGRMGDVNPNQAGATATPVFASYRLIPTAASHTYSIRAYHATAACTYTAGAGGVGAWMPGFIRVRKVQ